MLEYGLSCKCMDILDYPSTIGVCNNAGFHSPMAIASDCPATSVPGPVCNSIGGLFTTGDPAVAAFSACDLTCNHLHEQTIAPPDDTYQGCSFPAVGWTVAQTTTTASVYRTTAAVVVGDLLITAASVGSSGTDTPRDLTLKGPFSTMDPTGESAAEVHEDLPVYASEENNEVVLKVIEVSSGQPVNSFHLQGDGEDYVYGISAGGPGGTTLAMGGDFQGTITAITSVCTPTSVSVTNEAGDEVIHTVQCADGTTTATGHPSGSSWGAHLEALDVSDPSSPIVKWIIMPWPAGYENLMGGTRVDSVGNVYAVGYRSAPPASGEATGTQYCPDCDVVQAGVVAKFAAADGALLWMKEYSYLGHVAQVELDESNGVIFVSGEMKDGSSDLGTCVGGTCAMLACLSASDGATHWARHIHHGASSGNSFRGDGEVHLGKDSDGPYVYVSYNGERGSGWTNGPTTVDAGTPYAGCKDANGVVTPEYTISTSRLVEASDCPAGSTYIARTSAEAIPAQAAHTGHTCGFSTGTSSSCVVKYHSFTGLPIWASVTPSVKTFVPQADGIICIGSGSTDTSFDNVKLPSRGTLMIFQAKLDLSTGKGMYVQSIGGPGGSTVAYAAAEDEAGNVYAVGSTESQSVYATSMTSSSGLDSPIQTLPLAQSEMGEQFMVFKLNTGTASETPWCAPHAAPHPCPPSSNSLPDPNLHLHACDLSSGALRPAARRPRRRRSKAALASSTTCASGTLRRQRCCTNLARSATWQSRQPPGRTGRLLA